MRERLATLESEIADAESRAASNDTLAVKAIAEQRVQVTLLQREVLEADDAVAVALSRLHESTETCGALLAKVVSSRLAFEIDAARQVLRRWFTTARGVEWVLGEADSLDYLRRLAIQLERRVPVERTEQVCNERLTMLEKLLAGQWPWGN